MHGAVVWALLGDLSRDPDLPGDLRVEDAAAGGSADLVVVTGPDRVRRRLAGMAHAAGTQFLVANGPDEEHTWRAIVREATLIGAGVVVEVDGELPAHGRRWIERAAHLAWVICTRAPTCPSTCCRTARGDRSRPVTSCRRTPNGLSVSAIGRAGIR